jgi:hypothetical protein
MVSAADAVCSLFRCAMELISWLEAEVSSSEAACSEAPCASAWLDAETWRKRRIPAVRLHLSDHCGAAPT